MYSRLHFNIISFVLTILLLVAAIYYGYPQSGSQQYHIHLNGSFVLVDEEELLNRIKNIIQKNNITDGISLRTLEKSLGKEPFVDSATVRYSWPNELVIDISEVLPRAFIRNHGYLSTDCRIINNKQPLIKVSHIPVIQLEDIELNSRYCNKINQIISHFTHEIDYIVLMSNEDLRIAKGSVEYILGKNNQSGFEQLFLIDEQLQKSNETRLIVDLRYISGAAVKEVAML